MGPKIELFGTPEKIFPKSESFISIFTRIVISDRYDFNCFIDLSEN